MIIQSSFKPAWWCPGPHLQTLCQPLLRRSPPPPTRSERLELADGDFLDLVWTADNGGPIVVVLHGLEGSVRSPYARGVLDAIQRAGWRGCLMHFRGCSGEPNRLARGYHSGETGDLDTLVRLLRSREPATPLAAVGFSLGGNVLLKWLGEQGDKAPLRAAATVGVPLRLEIVAERLQQGFSRYYQRHLVRHLHRSYRRKFRHLPDQAPVGLDRIGRLDTFRLFDDQVTAPLHGYAGVDDYYARASSRQFLSSIAVPTLVLQARDDPFMTPEVLPAESELSAAVTLEVSRSGGHVGYIGGNLPGRPRYWLEERIPAFLRPYLEEKCPRPILANMD